MNDKKIIITEDILRDQSKVDVKIKEDKREVRYRGVIPNTSIYEMYQKYQNISLEQNHVLTLRRGK